MPRKKRGPPLTPEEATRVRRGEAIRTLAVRRAKSEALARSYNLPPDLRARETVLAVVLGTAGRALTRHEWLTAAGVAAGNGSGRSDGGRRNYILALEGLGLVARVKRCNPGTGARVPDLYLPTEKLLSLLAAGPASPS
jgi:hypothetical protein